MHPGWCDHARGSTSLHLIVESLLASHFSFLGQFICLSRFDRAERGPDVFA